MEKTVHRPLISEKSLTLAARGWYTFIVNIKTRKEEAAGAIEKLYNVNVTHIRSAHMHGKIRRVGRMMKYVQKPDLKKILVRLKDGQKIDAFEVTATETEKPKEEKSGTQKK